MKALETAKRDSRLFIVITFLSDLSFILPIWLLYSLDYLKLTPTLAVGLFMLVWIASGLLEIPTGAWADRFGRRKVFVIGNLLLAIYPIAYVLKPPLPIIIACCLIGGLGNALTSGTLLPVVHNAYKKAGLSEKQYHSFLSTKQMTTFIARALSGITGAALYAIHPGWPFIALSLATLACAGIALLIKDTSHVASTATNKIHISQTLTALRAKPLIIHIFIAYATANLVADSIWTGYQVLFKADGQGAVVIGALFSIIAVLSALGAYLVRKVPGRLTAQQVMLIFSLGVFLTALLLWQPITDLRLLAIIPMGIVSGTTIVTIQSAIQSNIANELQSTALSVSSFVTFMSYAAGSLMFGALVQLLGAQPTRAILLGLSVAAVLVGYSFARGEGTKIKVAKTS